MKPAQISTLKGATVDVKIWTRINEVESAALDQLRNTASLPVVHHHIAAMPDVHLGNGATVGSVVAMKGAVCPAAVGVDIGCVDAATEYLSPTGWKPIHQYDGGKIMEYDLDTGKAAFRVPGRFIDLPADKFYHIHTKYGVDQMLSPEHRCLVFKYDRGYQFDKAEVISAEELVAKHHETALGFRHRFLTCFEPDLDTSLPYSDAVLRVIMMVAADGHFTNRERGERCSIRVKKSRKIERARQLLMAAGIEFREELNNQGVTDFTFYAPVRLKTLSLWGASAEQLKIIVDEVFHWDGNKDERAFYTRIRESADFMQYAFSACGYRAVLRGDEKDGVMDWRVFAHDNVKVGINGTPKTEITDVACHNQRKYCFTTSTGFWVMRRGGNVAITGNCGMGAIKTNLDANKLDKKLRNLRDAIEARVPVGFNAHEKAPSLPLELENKRVKLFDQFGTLVDEVKSIEGKAYNQCGTLGGGNHFIEVCLDTDQNVWIMLHSGSRNIGKELAEIHMSVARCLGHNSRLPDKDLAYFLAGTPQMASYRHDLYWAQQYAFLNREIMFQLVKEAVLEFWPGAQFEEPIMCHHNYVAEEHHFGEDVFVTRKGAIRAGVGELGIIPGSMGTKSYIVRGLGNPDSFCSASHGAGRKMSRGQAKKKFTVEDLREQTNGVECRKDSGVLDEIPGAYKNIDQVMEDQKDLVEVVATLKQILCVKG